MSYSCNDNQNYFVEEGRTTSRVLAPPGGKTSICLGNWKPEESKSKPLAVDDKKPEEKENDDNGKKSAGEEESQTTVTETMAVPPKQPAPIGVSSNASSGSHAVSANTFASGSNMNSGNVMTGRPTSRVLAPPGGHCSIKLF